MKKAKIKRHRVARRPAEPELLGELLAEQLAIEIHGSRWLDAANQGYALHVDRGETQRILHALRAESTRHHDVRLPVWELLSGLATRAGVTLDPIFADFGLEANGSVSRRTGCSIARLLNEIGCAWEDTWRMLRRSFAEDHGMPLALNAVARNSKQTDESYDSALDRVEAAYPAHLSRELDEVRAAAVAAYRKS